MLGYAKLSAAIWVGYSCLIFIVSLVIEVEIDKRLFQNSFNIHAGLRVDFECHQRPYQNLDWHQCE